MSKYDPLWRYIAENNVNELTFKEVENILGFCIDHSFLTYKKKLKEFGFEVVKISMKEQRIVFKRS